MKLLVPVKGSIQNPTFSPDGKAFLFTRWRVGYSIGAADLYMADLRDRERLTLITSGELAGRMNVSSPGYGSTWHKSGVIIFSSDVAGVAWPHLIEPNGQDLQRLPGYDGTYIGQAPTLSPEGEQFAFERHELGSDQPGEIVVYMVDDGAGNQVRPLSIGDSRKPSWSPKGDMLAWQTKHGEHWRIAVCDLASRDIQHITPVGQDFRDPTWHPDGDRVLCSGDNALYEVTTTGGLNAVYAVDRPRTGYLGAGSWSPELVASGRRRLLCEATDRDSPEGGPGTWLEIY